MLILMVILGEAGAPERRGRSCCPRLTRVCGGPEGPEPESGGGVGGVEEGAGVRFSLRLVGAQPLPAFPNWAACRGLPGLDEDPSEPQEQEKPQKPLPRPLQGPSVHAPCPDRGIVLATSWAAPLAGGQWVLGPMGSHRETEGAEAGRGEAGRRGLESRLRAETRLQLISSHAPASPPPPHRLPGSRARCQCSPQPPAPCSQARQTPPAPCPCPGSLPQAPRPPPPTQHPVCRGGHLSPRWPRRPVW